MDFFIFINYTNIGTKKEWLMNAPIAKYSNFLKNQWIIQHRESNNKNKRLFCSRRYYAWRRLQNGIAFFFKKALKFSMAFCTHFWAIITSFRALLLVTNILLILRLGAPFSSYGYTLIIVTFLFRSSFVNATICIFFDWEVRFGVFFLIFSTRNGDVLPRAT